MRRLPVYLLIDVSDSMAGEPIAQVHKGVQTIVSELRNDPYALETVWLSLLVFAGKAETLVPLTEITSFQTPELPLGSGTSLGEGLELLMRHIDEDVTKTTAERKGDWKPMVFLFTDGAPTDDPAPAARKWESRYRKGCNLVSVVFGENADVAILQKLGPEVLALKDKSPDSFRQFFKWVSASLQVSSMAVAESGDDRPRLASTSGINLEKAEPGGRTDEQFVLLSIKCSRDKKLWLAKYDASSQPYPLVGAYPVEEEAWLRLGGNSGPAAQIDVQLLGDTPHCPICNKSDSFVQCNRCGKLGCSGMEKNYTCPWCGNSGKIVFRESFDVGRNQG